MAIATSRRIELDNWDRTAINLPFGRGVVRGRAVDLRAGATPTTRRSKLRALAVEDALNAATARAYRIADGRDGDRARG